MRFTTVVLSVALAVGLVAATPLVARQEPVCAEVGELCDDEVSCCEGLICIAPAIYPPVPGVSPISRLARSRIDAPLKLLALCRSCGLKLQSMLHR